MVEAVAQGAAFPPSALVKFENCPMIALCVFGARPIRSMSTAAAACNIA